MGTGSVSSVPSRGGENATGRYSSLSHGNLEFLKWSLSASRPCAAQIFATCQLACLKLTTYFFFTRYYSIYQPPAEQTHNSNI
jgi:hypothetical protein